MRIYVVLYDPQFNVLIAVRRTMTKWRRKAVQPVVSILEEAGLPCFLYGETDPADTYITAARRVFLEKTGFPVPTEHGATSMHLGGDFVMVSFRVGALGELQANINKGLVEPFALSPVPANNAHAFMFDNRWEIVDWELAKVQTHPRSNLGKELGTELTTGPQGRVDRLGYAGRLQALKRYAEIIAVLNSLG